MGGAANTAEVRRAGKAACHPLPRMGARKREMGWKEVEEGRASERRAYHHRGSLHGCAAVSPLSFAFSFDVLNGEADRHIDGREVGNEIHLLIWPLTHAAAVCD